ncbi:hypothetical protein E0H39_29575 [Rhizobium leguminosarum bv. viciae]|uniref:glycoside hydrolase family 108 protein n=1 Tax=Rhizobium leguminosarum TaxID=384 RepID=UPI00103D8977|nr:glycosyl hydrolase 108 family protein [Rhizobium leguminosarum]TBY57969.1 hypothetical protein E0H39_29575 [Rhizobium leguminosarum bv. viciae]
MKITYPETMAGIGVSEGGFSNHPADPGKATMKGITQAVFDEYLAAEDLPPRSVKLITDAEVAAIYRTRYANKIRYDDLPAGVDYSTMDAAVNSGVSRGSKWLQQSLGVSSDGVIGNQTIAAAAKADAVSTIKRICSKRTSFLQGLKTFAVFGKGWSSRVARVEAASVSMAGRYGGASASEVASLAKVESSSAKKSSKASAGAAGGTTAGSGTAATQFDWSHLTAVEIGLLAAGAVGIAILVVYLVHRSRIQSSRADAYAAVAAEGAAA